MKINGSLNGTSPSEKHFYVIGLSYKKADAEIRGHFSVSATAQNQLLEQAEAKGISSLFVISTCNRTELYGIAQHPFQLIELLCNHTNGSVEEFEKVAYIHKNKMAVSHLFKVATGLDSQILGDFEIISQLRNGLKRAKEHGRLNAYMERLGNEAIRASKRIKNETELSSGATSVSFAAVQYILARVPHVSKKNIVLFGTGKIGRNTCENLLKHTDNKHITLINRTKDKAERVAGKFNLIVKDYADIQSEISQCDVLIVATGAQQPTINRELLFLERPLLILDLSIPRNVAVDVQEHPLVTLVHLDDLTKVTDRTLEQRMLEVPAAEAIITEIEDEFNAWAANRKFAPTIKALKMKLEEMKAGEIDYQRKKMDQFNEAQAEIISDRIIQKITTHFANHLKNSADDNLESISLINKVFDLSNKNS